MKKEQKICIAVKAFLEHPTYTMSELSELPELKGISKSSIQRYLNDSIIINLLGQDTYDNVQALLKKNVIAARQKGGINSFKNNVQVQDSQGRFVASVKVDNTSKVEQKAKHIVTFSEIFLSNPSLSLQEMVEFYNKNNTTGEVVTRDYVYDCLTSNQVSSLLGKIISDQISEQLQQRRLQGNRNGANITNDNRKK